MLLQLVMMVVPVCVVMVMVAIVVGGVSVTRETEAGALVEVLVVPGILVVTGNQTRTDPTFAHPKVRFQNGGN